MRVRRHILIAADVDEALEELSKRFGVSRGELVEFMFYSLGGERGLAERLESVRRAEARAAQPRKAGQPEALKRILDEEEPLFTLE